jgi:hypothetical protein
MMILSLTVRRKYHIKRLLRNPKVEGTILFFMGGSILKNFKQAR